MVQTSVYTCNNVNLDPEMCLRKGEGVCSWRPDKVAQFKIEGLRSGSAVPPLDPRM